MGKQWTNYTWNSTLKFLYECVVDRFKIVFFQWWEQTVKFLACYTCQAQKNKSIGKRGRERERKNGSEMICKRSEWKICLKPTEKGNFTIQRENCTRKFTFVDIFNYDIFCSPLWFVRGAHSLVRSLFKFISVAQSIFVKSYYSDMQRVQRSTHPNINVAVWSCTLVLWMSVHLLWSVCESVSMSVHVYGVCVCCMALNHMRYKQVSFVYDEIKSFKFVWECVCHLQYFEWFI